MTITEDQAAALIAGAIASHSTGTSDETWDGPAMKARLSNDAGAATYRKAFAWQDPDGDPDAKATYKFIHHMVSVEGAVGAANMTGCSSAIGVLNGGRGGTKIPTDDRKGVYNHLARHLKDGDREPPELKASAEPEVDTDSEVLAEADSRARLATAPAGTLVAAARDPETGLPTRWHAYLISEGLRTSDGRAVRPGALIWRDLPLPLEWDPAGSDHEDAYLVAMIETIERDSSNRLYSTGPFDLGSPIGQEAARLCDEKMLRWVSPRIEVFTSELIEVAVAGDDGEEKYEAWVEVTSGRVAGAAMVTYPAFPQSVIAPEGEALPEVEPMGETPAVVPSVVASAAEAGVDLLAPPTYFFEDPCLPCPTPTVVTNEGRVLGHLALWGVEHTAFPNTKIFAPRSCSGYAYATTGPARRTAEGTDVRVGHLTLGTGHADLGLDYHETARHYDHTGTCVADVVFGEDEWGIWFSGALRPGVSPEQVLVLRASALSGDWRDIGGNLELVAALCVNCPGFPIVASAILAELAFLTGPRAAYKHTTAVDGVETKTPTALVAAGIVSHDPNRTMALRLVALEAQVASMRHAMAPTLDQAVEALRARLPKL
jgi:hypothetical protein